MSDELLLTALLCVDPGALDRAKRLATAINMLRALTAEQEVRHTIEEMYHCSRVTAWRTVDMARDVA